MQKDYAALKQPSPHFVGVSVAYASLNELRYLGILLQPRLTSETIPDLQHHVRPQPAGTLFALDLKP